MVEGGGLETIVGRTKVGVLGTAAGIIKVVGSGVREEVEALGLGGWGFFTVTMGVRGGVGAGVGVGRAGRGGRTGS